MFDDHVVQAGDALAGQPPQDIIFEIEEKPHSVFTRNKDDLVMTHTIPLVDALCGADISVTGVDGKLHKVHVDTVHPGTEKIVPGQGMPRKEGGRGNLHIKFHVTYPHLTEQQRAQLRSVLPR